MTRGISEATEMQTTNRRWQDKNGVTHSVVRRVRRHGSDAGWPPPRQMVTRCANEPVPDRDLAFGDVDCMSCLVAATHSKRRL